MYYALIALFFLLGSSCTWSSRPKDLILVDIENVAQLTLKEYQKVIATSLIRYDLVSLRNPSLIQTIKRQTISDWVTYQLIQNELKSLQILPTNEMVDEALEKRRKEFPDEFVWKETLIREMTTEDQLKEKILQELVFQKFFELISSNIYQPSLDERKAAYRETSGDFVVPDRIRVQQILVQDRVTAEQILDLIKQRKISFSQAAFEFSLSPEGKLRSGIIGWIEKDSFQPFNLLFKSPKTNHPQIIETPYGFHIVQVLEFQKGKKMSFEEMDKDIIVKLMNESHQAQFLSWLSDKIKKHKIYINWKAIERLEIKVQNEQTRSL